MDPEESEDSKFLSAPSNCIHQRHYFANKVSLVKAMVYPVVMYGCENWAIKKAEYRRTDAFELLCWKTLDSLGLQGDFN